MLVFPGIQPLSDRDRFKISLPKLLKQFFVFIHQTFVEHTGNQVGGWGILIKRHLFDCMQVIIKPITPFHIINQPPLIGKPIFKVSNRQW